jgi:hypothetical protein
MAASASEHEWLFDYLGMMFQQPSWIVPMQDFIDSHCVVFDDEDENKLAYTEVHQVRPARARARRFSRDGPCAPGDGSAQGDLGRPARLGPAIWASLRRLRSSPSSSTSCSRRTWQRSP